MVVRHVTVATRSWPGPWSAGPLCVQGVGMDLQDLRCFVVSAEEPSPAAAARRLHTSESALARRLQRLEQRLGVTLFERTPSAMELTVAGGWLLGRASALVEELQSASDQAHLLAAGGSVTPSPQGTREEAAAPVRLAVAELGPGDLRQHLSAAMPAHRIVPVAMPQVEALERLDSGDGVDAVWVYDVPGLPAHPLAHGAHVATVVVEPVWVLMGARHRLAGQDEVTVDDVAGCGLSWVVSPAGDRLRPWEESVILGRVPRAHLLDMGPTSHVVISQGRAVTLASPTASCTELLTTRPLVPLTTMHHYLTWQPQRVPAAVAAELLVAVRGFVRLCSQRNPRYWRWVCDHPADFPGIAPEPRPDPTRVRVAPARSTVDGLTPREHEVLTLVGAGLDNSEIARRLHLSPSTAKNHVMSIRTKLGARDRAQLVVLAHRHRLLD